MALFSLLDCTGTTFACTEISTARVDVARFLLRDSTFLQSILRGKIKFARRVRRYSELFLNLLRINKVSEKQRRLLEVVNFRQQLRRCLLSIVDNRSRPSSIDVRVASKVWQHWSVPAIVSCVDAADRHWSDSFVSIASVCCLRQSNGTSSFRLSSLVYHDRPVF